MNPPSPASLLPLAPGSSSALLPAAPAALQPGDVVDFYAEPGVAAPLLRGLVVAGRARRHGRPGDAINLCEPEYLVLTAAGGHWIVASDTLGEALTRGTARASGRAPNPLALEADDARLGRLLDCLTQAREAGRTAHGAGR